MKKEKKKKGILSKILTTPIVFNLLLMALVGFILVASTLYALNRYTRHNETVAVPDVKQMQVEDAIKVLAKADLECVVNDSVYLLDATPGAIIEQVPIAQSHVKTGRTIYLTTQAKSAQMITMPNLKDFSQRQALAQLHSLGFADVTIRKVASQYADLVISLSYKSDTVQIGQKIPKGAPLQLTVGSGGIEVNADNLDLQPEVDIETSFFD